MKNSTKYLFFFQNTFLSRESCEHFYDIFSWFWKKQSDHILSILNTLRKRTQDPGYKKYQNLKSWNKIILGSSTKMRF